MKPTTEQLDKLSKRITTFNQKKGICGFAASFCYLYSLNGSDFLDLIKNEHQANHDDNYKALAEKFRQYFKGEDCFSWFVAANIYRWTNKQDENIQYIKSFAIIFSNQSKDYKFDKQLGSLDGIVDFFVQIGIPLTSNNIENILEKYLPNAVITDSVYGKHANIIKFANDNKKLIAIIGLAVKEETDTHKHFGLQHWVFKNEDKIYNHGEIEDAESIAENYEWVCNSIMKK